MRIATAATRLQLPGSHAASDAGPHSVLDLGRNSLPDPKSIDALVGATAARLRKRLGAVPHLLLAYYTEELAQPELAAALARHAPASRIQGASSCGGIMTDEGFHAAPALALWGLHDPAGAYGVGLACLDPDPRAAGGEAVALALTEAEREGEMPDLVWLNGAPGQEEQVIAGIADHVGAAVPVVGGSSADNGIAGNWTQLAGGRLTPSGVALSACFPSTPVGIALHSGYEPTRWGGVVTSARDRLLMEIDGEPAARVYDAWTGGLLQPWLPGPANILNATSLTPLGVAADGDGAVQNYRLIHPERLTGDGGLTLFAAVAAGQRLTLMRGSREQLLTRAGRVTAAAMESGQITPEQVAGALGVYCAGCMLLVREEMEAVVGSIRDALQGAPFLGAFTFGEQGCFIGGHNEHGNLMISMAVFGARSHG